MVEASFVAGDWGTSHLRLFLCAANGTVLDTTTGPGAAEANGKYLSIWHSLLKPWQSSANALPAVLCGMVGSSIGWVQTSYLACPARPEQIADACAFVDEGDIRIIPGLSCRNRFNAPDLMRGEETQILGALSLEPRLNRGRHLLCLPGTHTKWVVLEDGAVLEFLTATTGEVYSLLCDHSVLVRDRGSPALIADGEFFEQGLAEHARYPEGKTLHRLFECRSRRLSGEFTSQASAAYLSGLLIGADVEGALHALPEAAATRSIFVIGAPQLTQLYATALETLKYIAQRLDGAAASLAGLIHVRRQLSQRIATHAL